MNLTNFIINTTVDNPLNVASSDLPDECLRGAGYSLECVYKTICPQFNEYFINVGATIIIAVILINWVKWWFFRWGYKRMPYNKFIGNLHELDVRMYWDDWINKRIFRLMLFYIVIVVWLAIGI